MINKTGSSIQPEILRISIILRDLHLPLKVYLEDFLKEKITDSKLYLNKRFNRNTKEEILKARKLDSVDFLEQLHFWADNWDYIAEEKGHLEDYIGQFREFIFGIKAIRNTYSGHLNFKKKTRWDFLRAYDTLYRVADEINAGFQVISQAKKHRDNQLRLIAEELEEGRNLEPEKFTLASGNEVSIEEVRKTGWEKEVLSVPVAKSFHLVEKHKIHSTPEEPKYLYKKSKYITFRDPKWEMHNLYEIQKIIRINCGKKNEVDLNELFKKGFSKGQKTLNKNELNRLREYCKAINFVKNKIIYVLSESCINLPHSPKPRNEKLLPLYYSLEELKSGKAIVSPDID